MSQERRRKFVEVLYEVVYQCPVCEIRQMEYDEYYTAGAVPKYAHVCECGHKEFLDKKYPYVIRERERSE